MELGNFLTFSIDYKLSCIQHFSQTQIFFATPKSINLYDLASTTIITSCNHSLATTANNPNGLNHDSEQETYNSDKKYNQGHEVLSPLEMHYFPQLNQSSQDIKESLNDDHADLSQFPEWNADQKFTSKKLGYLLVHYKMVGLSTYKIEQSSEPYKNFQLDKKSSISIRFWSFFPIKFGSAFLNLEFLTGIYHQINTKLNRELKEKYLSSKSLTTTHSLQEDLKIQVGMSDFILKENSKTGQFMIFENDDQVFQIKRLVLNNEGSIETKQTFQIDEQTAKLSSTTVTAIKYFQHRYPSTNKISPFLIMAMEAGDLCLYQLPNSKILPQKSQHYLQPIKTLNVVKFIQFKPKKEDLDYSVTAIQLLHQSMALLLVRNCGILLMNLKNFTIINQISLKNLPNKNNFLPDTRLIASIHSHLSINSITNGESRQDQSQTSEVKAINQLTNSIIQTTFVLTSKNTLKKLFIQLKIDKILEQSQLQNMRQVRVVQKVCKTKTKCNVIEQLNTPLIENILILKHHHNKYSPEKPSIYITQQTQPFDQQIQIFGNYQPDKIFYFTP